MPGPTKRTQAKARRRKANGHQTSRGHHTHRRHMKGCCWGMLPYITDFLEGEAGKTVCERIRKHLAGCEKCRMHLDVQLGIIGLYKKWRTGAMPDSVRVKLHKRLSEVMSRDSCP